MRFDDAQMRRRALVVAVALVCHAGCFDRGEETAKPTAEAAPTASPIEATVAGTPLAASRDPVIVAVTVARDLHHQAAAAMKEAVELGAHKHTLAQARRQMLLATSSLYNSGVQLKRAARKEVERAASWQMTGEQKERIADGLETEAEQAETKRRAKAYLAYADLQNEMASAMTDFASKLEGLSKQSQAAADNGDVEVFTELHDKIEATRDDAEQLYADVTRIRAKLDTMLR